MCPPLGILSAKAALGLVAVVRGESGSAGEHYDYLRQYPGIVVPGILRSVDRLLGLLSQTMGNIDQAVTHFEDALAFCRKAGYRPELAWTCCDYADLLMERVTERLEQSQAPSGSPPNYPGGLNRTGSRGFAADRRRQDQFGNSGSVGHRRRNRAEARRQHLRKDWRSQPGGGGCIRQRAGPPKFHLGSAFVDISAMTPASGNRFATGRTTRTGGVTGWQSFQRLPGIGVIVEWVGRQGEVGPGALLA